ncbi:class A beta-lactamase [Altererythrobacter salegens]|uniref:Beta-lactamase n=1 Tax=Croceibacterium salegens TaxID=1737568 RepID=A0A6I4T1K4_9SPHN|nr:class A beta-lactamase [Croceibacterium salegens]MXO61147.1 class A beta-lactamase [Croceibacterium salegens]
MVFRTIGRLIAPLALALAMAVPAHANDAQGSSLEAAFDSTFGTDSRVPRDFTPRFDSPFERLVAQLADGSNGRIGVAAVDLSTGQEVGVLGDQRFPMASTSKVAIAATYLEGVDKGRWTLTRELPLLVPVRSAPFSSKAAPVKEGQYYTALELIDLMLTRSNNAATDSLLHAVGGPAAVNDWARRAGIKGFNLSRDIATLVRDDGEFDPASHIDIRDSSTPRDMVLLLTGLYQGQWLSAESRRVLIDTMERCRTGTHRIPALLPENVRVAHKTGSLNNTSSDVGIMMAPDGRSIAVAIYVTGQGSRANREAKIASIARAIYDGYAQSYAQRQAEAREWTSAKYSDSGG